MGVAARQVTGALLVVLLLSHTAVDAATTVSRLTALHSVVEYQQSDSNPPAADQAQSLVQQVSNNTGNRTCEAGFGVDDDGKCAVCDYNSYTDDSSEKCLSCPRFGITKWKGAKVIADCRDPMSVPTWYLQFILMTHMVLKMLSLQVRYGLTSVRAFCDQRLNSKEPRNAVFSAAISHYCKADASHNMAGISTVISIVVTGFVAFFMLPRESNSEKLEAYEEHMFVALMVIGGLVSVGHMLGFYVERQLLSSAPAWYMFVIECVSMVICFLTIFRVYKRREGMGVLDMMLLLALLMVTQFELYFMLVGYGMLGKSSEPATMFWGFFTIVMASTALLLVPAASIYIGLWGSNGNTYEPVLGTNAHVTIQFYLGLSVVFALIGKLMGALASSHAGRIQAMKTAFNKVNSFSQLVEDRLELVQANKAQCDDNTWRAYELAELFSSFRQLSGFCSLMKDLGDFAPSTSKALMGTIRPTEMKCLTKEKQQEMKAMTEPTIECHELEQIVELLQKHVRKQFEFSREKNIMSEFLLNGVDTSVIIQILLLNSYYTSVYLIALRTASVRGDTDSKMVFQTNAIYIGFGITGLFLLMCAGHVVSYVMKKEGTNEWVKLHGVSASSTSRRSSNRLDPDDGEGDDDGADGAEGGDDGDDGGGDDGGDGDE